MWCIVWQKRLELVTGWLGLHEQVFDELQESVRVKAVKRLSVQMLSQRMRMPSAVL